MVIVFALILTACVLGVVVWKALDAEKTTLARGQTDIQNLAHSLAEHAAHAIQSADIAMAGMVDLLKYRDPIPERFNRYLAETVSSLPQLREIGVLDTNGKWLYSSLPQTPLHNNSDRRYFAYHRETPGSALRISEPLQSRLTERSTIILSKRIEPTGRQLRRRPHRRDRQRLLQPLLPELPARSRRQHHPAAE